MRNGTPCREQKLDRLVESRQRTRLVGDRHDLDSPIGGVRAVGCVHAQDELGSRGDRQRNLGRIEAVDRDTDASVSQCGDGIAGLRPCRARDRNPGR